MTDEADEVHESAPDAGSFFPPALSDVAAEVPGAVLVVQGAPPVPSKKAADESGDSFSQLPVDVRRDAEPA